MIGPDNAKLAGFKDLLLTKCGLGFENEREATLIRAICQRMTSRSKEDCDDYHGILTNDSDEFDRLVELLTVNETYFFREPDHLKLLVERLIPDIVEERKGGRIRIVSAGCSTGEEPYSIAMLLHERYGTDFVRLFAITGVDIDTTAIDRAKQGVYGKNSFRTVDADRLGLYFEPFGGNECRIKEEIRQNVTFEVINLLGADYPASMQTPDVILYRNVSIYFPGQVQHAIFSRLAGLLAEGGYLLVGATETIHHNLGILSLVEKDELFFYRKLPNIFIEDRRNRSSAGGERGGSAVRAGRPATPTARGQQRAPRHGQSSLTHAQKQRPLPNAHTLFDDALGLAHDNRLDAALELLDTLIGRDDTFVKAYLLKGTILLNSSRFDEARENCDKALANNPLCLEASLMLGIIARHDENDDEALRRFREAIYLDSACWPGHFYTAEISYARGDMKRACSAYESALRILEGEPSADRAQTFFPLAFKADQFTAICRHKLARIRVQGK
jgi:chemotaxis protein methyltransferase CheR